MTRSVGAAMTAVVAAVLLMQAAIRPAAVDAQAPARKTMKHVLAWGDVRSGYQHDSISHAFAVIERLGRESGLFDTFFRTDSQLITKGPVAFPPNVGIALGPNGERGVPLAHNLDYFDAIFFFGVREVDITPEQKRDLLAFVHDDGKGFVTAHSGATAFFSWPEFGEMLGGRFDEHPWGVSTATVVVDDPAFPAMRHLPRTSARVDEHYQIKEFARDRIRVLAHLDPASVDMRSKLVHRQDGDFPVAWAKTYGKGRVFYSTLGHDAAYWDDPAISTMYFEAIKWALGLTEADATPGLKVTR